MRERLISTGIYGTLHFLVDFGCAFLIFRVFSDSESFIRISFCIISVPLPFRCRLDSLLTGKTGMLRWRWQDVF